MALADLTDPGAVRRAVEEFDRFGRDAFLHKYGFGRAREYFVVSDDGRRRYVSKAVAGVAYRYQFPERGPLTAADFSGGEATVKRKLEELGFTVAGPVPTAAGRGSRTNGAPDHVQQEQGWRLAAWRQLHEAGGPEGVAPELLLRELGIYGGAQGVWVDKARTGAVAPEGVAVGLLHTGSAYADDLAADGVIYHYPRTGRPPGRDAAEVAAVRAAQRLGLPVFVVVYPRPKAPARDVRLGWVVGDDPAAGWFLVEFGEVPPPAVVGTAEELEQEPFELEEREAPRRAILECIEVFYNRQRRHSGLSFLTPAQAYTQMAKAA